MNASPQVFVVDDDPGVCKSLCTLLRSIKLPTVAFESGKAFLDHLDGDRLDQPGCAILDLRMPGISGLEVQEELNIRGAMLPLIFISAHGDVSCAVRALKGGAFDFLEKPFRGQELLDRVNRCVELDAQRRAARAWRKTFEQQLASLTPAERAVLDLMVDGQPYKVIASRLDISYKTVEARRSVIARKLEVENLPELIHKVLTFRLSGSQLPEESGLGR